MGLLFSCIDYSDTEIDYDDYIFEHQEILGIKTSQFLTRNLKQGDYIVLEITIDGYSKQHTCLVKRVKPHKIYVILLTPVINARKFRFIKYKRL